MHPKGNNALEHLLLSAITIGGLALIFWAGHAFRRWYTGED